MPEQDYDGAEPAPTSIAVANLLRLAALAEPDTAEALRERARQAIAAFQERLGEAALAVPQLCCSAHLFACGPPSLARPCVSSSLQHTCPYRLACLRPCNSVW